MDNDKGQPVRGEDMELKNSVAEHSAAPNCYLAIHSTDRKFMCRLIDWLNNQDVAKGSTVIRVHDMDPYEEVDLLRAQIEGMTIRIRDAEQAAR